jgi:hypothetical protein
LLDESKDDYRESGSRTRDLQRRARQETGDDAAGDRTDETGDHRGSGSQGNTQGKGHGHEKDDEGGGEISTKVHGFH